MKNRINWIRTFAMALVGFTLITNRVEAGTLKTINQSNRNLVPLRVVSEELGATVNYNGVNKQITVVYNESVIVATIGSKSAVVNGKKQAMQVAPQVIKDVTYVPIRFIGEALGGQVDYQKGSLKITIADQVKQWKLETTPTDAEIISIISKAESRLDEFWRSVDTNYMIQISGSDLPVAAYMQKFNSYSKIKNYLNLYWSQSAVEKIVAFFTVDINGVPYGRIGDITSPDYSNGTVLKRTDSNNKISVKVRGELFGEAYTDDFILIYENEKWVLSSFDW